MGQAWTQSGLDPAEVPDREAGKDGIPRPPTVHGRLSFADMTRLGFGLAVGAPEATVRASAKAAEEAGFRTFWLNHPPNQDGLAPLGWAADATSRIALGTGVVPISHRSPASILEGIEQAALPRGRYRLGIGSGSGPHPLRAARAALEELRPQAGCELVLAALGPGMCELAGRDADSVLLNWVTPEHARLSADLVLKAAKAAGRPRPGLYAYVRVALGEASLARLEREAAMYTAIPSYGANFARMEVKAVETAVGGRTAEEVQAGLRAWDGVVDEVVVRAVPAHDQVDEALAILEAASGAL
jgi:alkanesulfonate monooxygenase SsuD/methylene tetrahydromethanopterin reductase-like flavin-dependent oxidoreductase (luciferase family)